MSLVGRGVFRRSYLTPEGREVLVAVDFESKEVGSVILEPDDNQLTVLAELWDLLDLADPEHQRRIGPRDPMAKKAANGLNRVVAALPLVSTLAVLKVWLLIGHHVARWYS